MLSSHQSGFQFVPSISWWWYPQHNHPRGTGSLSVRFQTISTTWRSSFWPGTLRIKAPRSLDFKEALESLPQTSSFTIYPVYNPSLFSQKNPGSWSLLSISAVRGWGILFTLYIFSDKICQRYPLFFLFTKYPTLISYLERKGRMRKRVIWNIQFRITFWIPNYIESPQWNMWADKSSYLFKREGIYL